MSFEMEIPFVRQVDMALQKMEEELKGMVAGTIVLQVRNDAVGKFGIRHLPVDLAEKRQASEHPPEGLTASQVTLLRKRAVEAIGRNRSWTHGEVTYDFVLKQGKLYLSVTVESNYNMANVLFRVHNNRRDRRDNLSHE